MDVLKYIKEDDYEVIVRTDDIMYSWSNFKGRINYRNQLTHNYSDPLKYCTYTAKDVVDFYIYNPENGETVKQDDINETLWPVVFETNKYQICVKFHRIDNGSKPKVVHILKDVEKAFFIDREESGTEARLTGEVDFLNQPGLFKLNFEYQKNGHKKDAYVTFDIVSPKLDTKHDYKKILRDVNQEFDELVFNYLSTTFQQFARGKKQRNSLERWMQTFQDVVKDYLESVDRIIKNPHSKVRTIQLFAKGDNIKRWTPAMEEKYKEVERSGKLEEHYFEYNQYDNTVNTMENRFVKYTLKQIGGKLQLVFSTLLIKGNQEISQNYISEWEKYQRKIQKYIKHPFFKAVGKFEGLRQESLVLQSRMGYQQVYKDWLKLNKGIDFYNGATNIGTLQIWEIYELWCFLKMKNMVRKLMGFDPDKKDSEYGDLIVEENGSLIEYKKDKKTDYRIKFVFPNPDDANVPEKHKELIRQHQGEEVSLHYQHTFNRRCEDDFNVQTVTTEQRPDIVLNIRKTDGFVLTYLYDAKYRVWGDKHLDKDFEKLDEDEQKEILDAENRELTDTEKKLYGADYPPSDAINQMHRYRDAIYYGLDKDNRPDSKEIIGGYILFPGRGDDKHIKERYFSKSIETVNIGAFPLLPLQGEVDEQGKDVEGPQLWEHLNNILLEKEVVYSHIEKSVPQRGLHYTDDTNAKWKRIKVLLFTDPHDIHWQNIDSYQYVALGLNLSRFSLKTVGLYSKAKYVAIVSQHIEKKIRLFKVDGSAEIVDEIDEKLCLKRNFFEQEEKDKKAQVYLQYKLKKDEKPSLSLDSKAIHEIQAGSHNPKVVTMDKLLGKL